MAARDIIHEPVRKALENDGWTMTADPLTLKFEDKCVLTDLGAERILVGAERGLEKIAVEIKSFVALRDKVYLTNEVESREWRVTTPFAPKGHLRYSPRCYVSIH